MRISKTSKISRRDFMAAGKYTIGGLTLTGIGFQAQAQTGTPNMQPHSVMSRLSGFISAARYDTIPTKAIENAKTAIMDCLGVAVAGGKEESAQIVGRLAREERSKEEATIYAQHFKSSALQAAFV